MAGLFASSIDGKYAGRMKVKVGVAKNYIFDKQVRKAAITSASQNRQRLPTVQISTQNC
ncbi:hypothetical protein [Epilithonimonas vandammei]|uniref:hypothetical protein n=1 Tax=Epilithonimonas vandammei TaxID=2487072 RepID=UPI00289DBDCC|nr:hypothetical protein [Epilithonimonas vandammei]